MNRRHIIKTIAATTATAIWSKNLAAKEFAAFTANAELKGNINHSVCRWTFSDLTVEELCIAVKKIGFAAIDLVGPKDWPIL